MGANNLSTFAVNAFSNWLHGKADPPATGTRYLALFTSSVTKAGNGIEVTGGGYARQNLTTAMPTLTDSDTNGRATSNADVTFPAATTNWGALTDWAEMDSNVIKTFTNSDVNTGTDGITSTSHGIATGTQARVSKASGATMPGGITEGTAYYVRSVDSNTISLHPTAADASGNTNKIDITAAGSGTFSLGCGNVLSFGKLRNNGDAVDEPETINAGSTPVISAGRLMVNTDSTDGTLVSNGAGGYFRNFPQLYRGINLYNCFMGADIYGTNWQANYISAQGLTNLRLWGFKHVRIPIDINFLCDPTANPVTLNSTRMSSLDTVISNAISAGLVVILGLWPEADAYRVGTDTASHASYGNFWAQVVNRYKATYGGEQIFFEILNEPHFQVWSSDATARSNWANYRTTVINAIRTESTAHWLIVPDYTWNGVQSVIDYNTVIADTKIIYGAHYYEFIAFTYQGMAEIGDPLVEALHNLPYPMRQPEFDNCMATLTSQQQADMAWYASTNFGYSTILSTMTAWRNWSKANGVPIYLGEFGCGRIHSIPGDAETWLRDVRRAAEANNIPHADWALIGKFNLLQSLGGNPVASVLSALQDP